MRSIAAVLAVLLLAGCQPGPDRLQSLEAQVRQQDQQLRQMRQRLDGLESRPQSPGTGLDTWQLWGRDPFMGAQPGEPRRSDSDSFAVKVDRLKILNDIAGLGPLLPPDPLVGRDCAPVKELLGSGHYKLVVAQLRLRNQSLQPRHLGWRVPLGEVLWLRGADGQEVCSDASGVTGCLPGGLPEDVQVAPEGEISGQVVFLVPHQFHPSSVLVKPENYDLGRGAATIPLG